MLELTVACGDYDRTRAIKDGRVRIEGCKVTFTPPAPEEVFFRSFRKIGSARPHSSTRGSLLGVYPGLPETTTGRGRRRRR